MQDEEWYAARVVEARPSDGRHRVLYFCDGEVRRPPHAEPPHRSHSAPPCHTLRSTQGYRRTPSGFRQQLQPVAPLRPQRSGMGGVAVRACSFGSEAIMTLPSLSRPGHRSTMAVEISACQEEHIQCTVAHGGRRRRGGRCPGGVAGPGGGRKWGPRLLGLRRRLRRHHAASSRRPPAAGPPACAGGGGCSGARTCRRRGAAPPGRSARLHPFPHHSAPPPHSTQCSEYRVLSGVRPMGGQDRLGDESHDGGTVTALRMPTSKQA